MKKLLLLGCLLPQLTMASLLETKIDTALVAKTIGENSPEFILSQEERQRLKEVYNLEEEGPYIGVNIDHNNATQFVRKYGITELGRVIENKLKQKAIKVASIRVVLASLYGGKGDFLKEEIDLKNLIDHLDKPDKKISLLEDPVEDKILKTFLHKARLEWMFQERFIDFDGNVLMDYSDLKLMGFPQEKVVRLASYLDDPQQLWEEKYARPDYRRGCGLKKQQLERADRINQLIHPLLIDTENAFHQLPPKKEYLGRLSTSQLYDFPVSKVPGFFKNNYLTKYTVRVGGPFLGINGVEISSRSNWKRHSLGLDIRFLLEKALNIHGIQNFEGEFFDRQLNRENYDIKSYFSGPTPFNSARIHFELDEIDDPTILLKRIDEYFKGQEEFLSQYKKNFRTPRLQKNYDFEELTDSIVEKINRVTIYPIILRDLPRLLRYQKLRVKYDVLSALSKSVSGEEIELVRRQVRECTAFENQAELAKIEFGEAGKIISRLREKNARLSALNQSLTVYNGKRLAKERHSNDQYHTGSARSE